MKYSREERLSGYDRGEDYRSPFQRDLDRLLYSPELRRLSGVTQVASATEGDVFHNRLTHSLKVAQVGRRIAERLIIDTGPDLIEAGGGLHPDVVEAAGLAHDLGHPPFGHDGEEVICEAMQAKDPEGFEGNAQTFRIVTRLSEPESPKGRGFGLDLTKATLNAILKYPRLSSRDCKGSCHQKWGAYRSEEGFFAEARENLPDEQSSIEAKIMDWADDVTYAVHDLDDFYRAGLIPLHQLHKGGTLEEIFDSDSGIAPVLEQAYFHLTEPFQGTGEQRTVLRTGTSALLTRFINAVTLSGDPPSIRIGEDTKREVRFLKKITKYYVIEHPRVVSVREGQRRVLKQLFETYIEAIDGKQKRLRPLLPQATVERLDSGDTHQRLAADLLAGMTERQVLQTYHRLTGFGSNPVSHFDL